MYFIAESHNYSHQNLTKICGINLQELHTQKRKFTAEEPDFVATP